MSYIAINILAVLFPFALGYGLYKEIKRQNKCKQN